jgi:PAS domain S-box-containing protein
LAALQRPIDEQNRARPTLVPSSISPEQQPAAGPAGKVLPVAAAVAKAEEMLAHLSAESDRWKQLYEAVLANTPDLGYVFDLHHRFTYANDALLAMWGKTWEEAIGRNCLELGYEPWHAAMHDREIEQVIATKKAIRGEVPFNGTNGRRIYDYIFFPVFGSNREVEAVGGTTRDITDIKEAEHVLRWQSTQQSILVDEAPLGVYLIDSNFRIQQVNPIALPVFGDITNLIGRDVEEVFRIMWGKELADELVQIFRRVLETGEPYEIEQQPRVRADRGVTEYYESRIVRVPIAQGKNGLVCYFRDISARVKAEEALRQTEKLTAAGRLAATVAHEINNPLEAVTNLLFLARNDTSLSKETRSYLAMANKELDRAAHVARQTLGFYRDTAAPCWLDPAQTIKDLARLYSHRLRDRDFTLETSGGDPVQVFAAGGEFRQVFSNLLVNAADATESGSGKIRVTVRAVTDWTRPGASGVRISVADNGYGIDPSHLAKIFNAFYSTKKEIGTGLGLWLVRSILQRHQARIKVRSRSRSRPNGTTFSIFWPNPGEASPHG